MYIKLCSGINFLCQKNETIKNADLYLHKNRFMSTQDSN